MELACDYSRNGKSKQQPLDKETFVTRQHCLPFLLHLFIHAPRKRAGPGVSAHARAVLVHAAPRGFMGSEGAFHRALPGV